MAVDVLPTAAPMWYDKDPTIAAVSIAKNGSAPYEVMEATRIELEPFAIVSWVKVPVQNFRTLQLVIVDEKLQLFGEHPTCILYNKNIRDNPDEGLKSFGRDCTLEYP